MSVRVLIVEDEMSIAGALAEILTEEGHQATAVNGPAAYAAATSGGFDVMLLDLVMPVVDGEAVAAQLRADPETVNLPIVLMSAHPWAREAAARIGVQGLLLKPFGIEEMLRAITRASSATFGSGR